MKIEKGGVLAVGRGIRVNDNGYHVLVIGRNASVTKAEVTIIGMSGEQRYENLTPGYRSTAVGFDSLAAGRDSVAIGYGSVATERDTVSFGTTEEAWLESTQGEGFSKRRRLVNVADGRAATDAATVGQLDALSTSQQMDKETLLSEIEYKANDLQSKLDALTARVEALENQ